VTARLSLAVAVLAIGGLAFIAASGTVGPLAAALQTGFTGFVGILAETPTPTSVEIVATGSPIIASPANAYTNQPKADLKVTIPADVAGMPNARVKVYLALEGLSLSPIAEVPVGSTTRLSILVDLTKGRNDFSATIIRDGAESEPSPVVTYFLDQDAPTIKLSAPVDGATVNETIVAINGTTEAASNLVARNEANGTSVTALAGADGGFSMSLPLVPGPNGIKIDATDPAGNTGSLIISVLQGSGKLSASLSASAYRISVSSLPAAFQLEVLVTDPTGAPLAGASAFFTLQVPGLGPLSSQVVTGADGRAIFTTQLTGPITTGTGAGTVVVTQPVFGSTTDRVDLTFVK
jgi:hypothetical protein